MEKSTIIGVTFLVILALANGSPGPERVQQIYEELQKGQYPEDTTFRWFPPRLDHIKGLYSSYVRVNTVDKDNSWLFHMMRQLFQQDDNNMFVTSFVAKAILDSHDLGYLDVDQQSLSEAVDAVLSFQDKNLSEGLPIYTFWPQSLKEGVWSCSPTNLLHSVQAIDYMPQWLLDFFAKLDIPLSYLAELASVFVIPPDTDDSSVNMVLGSFFESHKDEYPELAQKWHAVNTDFKGYFDTLKKYAYRPFLNYNNKTAVDEQLEQADVIDTRTYMYLHEFVEAEEAQSRTSNQDPELILLATWLTKYSEQVPEVYEMPLDTNNVDISVNANGLFGINSFLLGYDQTVTAPLFDDELKKMYSDVTNFLEWGIKTDVTSKRPDLALTYYPSVFDFYWFVARNVQVLQSAAELPFPEMKTTLDKLGAIMRTEGTAQILARAETTNDGAHMNWKEFLGDYAGKEWGEDNVFATSMAVNSLLDVWTIRSSKSELTWLKDTPQEVKDAVVKGIDYIDTNIDKVFPALSNAFFSGSVKTPQTYPFVYPGNLAHYKNGTQVDPHTIGINSVAMDLLYSWKGFVPAEEYQDMVNNQKWFGFKSPQTFTTLNLPGTSFPYWSSPPMTLSMAMLAMAKVNAVSE